MIPGAEFLLAAALTIALDAASKRFVAARLRTGQAMAVMRHVAIRLVRNATGGPVTGRALALRALALAGLGGAIALLQASGLFFQDGWAQAGLGAAIGGAASNFYDRGRNGEVVDFVAIGWWPPFNVADVGIVAGAALALIFLR